MKELLEQLGFTYFTGNLYRHELLGIIQMEENDTPNDLVKKIYNRGYGECQEIIKSALGIKPN